MFAALPMAVANKKVNDYTITQTSFEANGVMLVRPTMKISRRSGTPIDVNVKAGLDVESSLAAFTQQQLAFLDARGVTAHRLRADVSELNALTETRVPSVGTEKALKCVGPFGGIAVLKSKNTSWRKAILARVEEMNQGFYYPRGLALNVHHHKNTVSRMTTVMWLSLTLLSATDATGRAQLVWPSRPFNPDGLIKKDIVVCKVSAAITGGRPGWCLTVFFGQL